MTSANAGIAIDVASSFAREGYREIPIYTPSREQGVIDLGDNTNLWGPAPSAKKALQHYPFAEVRRYPSAYSAELKDTLAIAPRLQLASCRIVSRFERGNERGCLRNPPAYRFSQRGLARCPLMGESARDESAA